MTDGGDRTGWIDEAWQWIIRSHDEPDADPPTWADRPALTRITVSSPLLHRPFSTWNRGKPWAGRVKPFNFLLVAETDPSSRPEDVPERFRLITPYTTDRDATALEWRNLYDPDGPTYTITTGTDQNRPTDAVGVKSFGQVLREYRVHPEYKFDDSQGRRVCPEFG